MPGTQEKLRYSLGRPSRSDLVQSEFVESKLAQEFGSKKGEMYGCFISEELK